MRKSKIRSGIGAIGIGVVAGVSLAVGARGEDMGETVELEPVIVTATRTEANPNVLGSSVTVITAEELANNRVTTVLEALRAVPGLDVVQSGGPGRITSVFIRGHNSEHTRVMLDGVRLNSSTGGGYDLGNIAVNNIERIEIVRGPQSALYGSDAIAGVVNIITKRGREGIHGSVEGAAGTKGYRSGGLSLSGGNEFGDFSIGYTGNRFDGTSVAAEELGNTEEDGWQNHGLSGRVGLNFLDDGRTDLFLNYNDDTSDLDGFVWPNPSDDPNYERERESVSGKLQLSKPILDWYTQTLSVGLAREDLTGDDPDTAANRYEITSETRTLSAKADFFPFEGDTLSLGYDFERQAGENPGNNIDESLDIHSFLIQNHWTYQDTASFTAGIRHDDHETFGGETTFRLAGSAKVPGMGTRFHGSYGTGFRAPTLNDLYWPNTGWAVGNPNVTAETSKSLDIGIEQSLLGDRVVADVTYFQSKVENLIQWAGTGPNWWDPWMPQNVAEAEINGVETTLALRPTADLDLRLGYTYTDHEDATTGAELARRPRHRYSASANYRFIERANVNLSVIHVGRRYDDAANAEKLAPYTRVDLAASYDVTDHVQVFGRIENLFDEDYEEARGFGVAGRYAFAGLKLSF